MSSEGPVPGYNPPPGSGGSYGSVPPGAPYRGPVIASATWFSRVLAVIIDGIIVTVVGGLLLSPGGYFLATDSDLVEMPDGSVQFETVSALGVILVALGVILYLAFAFWNMIVRVSRRGGSLGKSAMGIRVVGQQTGKNIGVGTAFLRYLLNAILGNLCFLNYLWPLWDPQNRTWHDMIVSTYVVRK